MTHADTFVTQAGYNNVMERASLNKAMIAIPYSPPEQDSNCISEQAARTASLSQPGYEYLTSIAPDDLLSNPERLAIMINEARDRNPEQLTNISFSGQHNAAQIVTRDIEAQRLSQCTVADPQQISRLQLSQAVLDIRSSRAKE